MDEETVDILKGERCPLCLRETLTLMERVLDVPHFGVTHVFSMHCENPDCEYDFADVEREESRGAMKEEIEISSEEQLRWYVVRSAAASLKIPRMVDIAPGPDSSGFITTVEGVLQRFRQVLEEFRADDDPVVAKRAKTHLKKLQRVLWGQEAIRLVLEDKTGNSGFIREHIVLQDE